MSFCKVIREISYLACYTVCDVRDAQIMMFLDLALKITNNYKTGSNLY